VLAATGAFSQKRPLGVLNAPTAEGTTSRSLLAAAVGCANGCCWSRSRGERLESQAPPSICTAQPHPLMRTVRSSTISSALDYRVAEGPGWRRPLTNFTALNTPRSPGPNCRHVICLKLTAAHRTPHRFNPPPRARPPLRSWLPQVSAPCGGCHPLGVSTRVEVLAIDRSLDFSHLRGHGTIFAQSRICQSSGPATSPQLGKKKKPRVRGGGAFGRRGCAVPPVARKMRCSMSIQRARRMAWIRNAGRFARRLVSERFCNGPPRHR